MMNPCLPHPVGASSTLTYTLSGLTEAQLATGINVSLANATVPVNNLPVEGAAITDLNNTTIGNVSLVVAGILGFD